MQRYREVGIDLGGTEGRAEEQGKHDQIALC